MGSVAFDIDGTISELWYKNTIKVISKQMLIHSEESFIAREYVNSKLRNLKPLMIPCEAPYLITSRCKIFRKATEEWLLNNGIYVLEVCMPDRIIMDEEVQIARKARIINNLKVEYYFEDEKKMRKELSKLCPDTKILEPYKALELGFAHTPEYK